MEGEGEGMEEVGIVEGEGDMVAEEGEDLGEGEGMGVGEVGIVGEVEGDMEVEVEEVL